MKYKKIIKIAVLAIFLAIFLFSGYKVVSTLVSYKQSENVYSEIAKNAVTVKDISDEQAKTEAPISINFDLLKSQNKDIVGWLYLPGTEINYPVLKGDDNQEYINKMFNGQKNRAGSLFADYRLGNIENSYNYVIYGHSMKNDSMFGTLKDFLNQEYFNEHQVFYYLTPEKSYIIKVHSGFITPADSNAYKLNHNDESLAKYMAEAKKKSSFKSSVEYKDGDRIMTLSTCAYNYEDARYVVIGIIEELK